MWVQWQLIHGQQSAKLDRRGQFSTWPQICRATRWNWSQQLDRSGPEGNKKNPLLATSEQRSEWNMTQFNSNTAKLHWMRRTFVTSRSCPHHCCLTDPWKKSYSAMVWNKETVFTWLTMLKYMQTTKCIGLQRTTTSDMPVCSWKGSTAARSAHHQSISHDTQDSCIGFRCVSHLIRQKVTFLTTNKKQVRLVSAKAERPNHKSRSHARQGGGSASQGGGSSTPTQTWLHNAACFVTCNFRGVASQRGSARGGGVLHTNDNDDADVTP